MDATHLALILVVVVVVILLVSRRRRPGNTLTWTFRVPLGRKPNLEGLNTVGLGTRVKEGEISNVLMSDAKSAQLQGQLTGAMRSNLQANESLGQRVLEQLFLPKSLLRDVEVQKLFEQGFAYLQQENYDQAIPVFQRAVNLAHHNLYQAHAKPEIEGRIAAFAIATSRAAFWLKGRLTRQ
jgi:tetratricopeptide (TPR) repeat protein